MFAPIAGDRRTTANDAESIAEAVQRPTMKFVATKTAEQLDLQALHRVRERLMSQRTGIINQIRAFMLERGIAVRQGIGSASCKLGYAFSRALVSLACMDLRADQRYSFRKTKVGDSIFDIA
jgi:Transposase